MNAMTPNDQRHQSVNSHLRRLSPPGELERLALWVWRCRTAMFLPRGTAHTFQNVGTEPGVLLVGVTPDGFEKLFEERQGVDAETNRILMKAHNMEVVGPPLK